MTPTRNLNNAPGPFYVRDGECLACEAPFHEAPELMAFDENRFCYFKKQPLSSEELEQAMSAICVGCIRAVRYGGDDPQILKRLSELSSADCCDVLCDSTPISTQEAEPAPQPVDRQWWQFWK